MHSLNAKNDRYEDPIGVVKVRSLLFSLWIVCSLTSLRAQTGPEIHGDGRVTFRFRHEAANDVVVRGQWSKEPTVLSRAADDRSVWSVTSNPIPPGVWEYNFVIDGLSVIDPSNPSLKPQRNPSRSILHIAGSPPNPWDFQDIPHGTVHQHWYDSDVVGRPRPMTVYTPPGYETSGDQLYPLLILQHGSGDNQATWVEHGKANWIADRLIADGSTLPMIILMIDGHPLGQIPRENAAKRDESLTVFERELFDEAIPLAELLYRVAPSSDQRAIAGLSMGGWQSINVGLRNSDRFAWVGSFSGAANIESLQSMFEKPESVNQQLKLLWIACGKEDFLLSMNEAMTAALDQHGIQHEWHLTEGDHSWPVWRTYLTEFLPKLFQRPIH